MPRASDFRCSSSASSRFLESGIRMGMSSTSTRRSLPTVAKNAQMERIGKERLVEVEDMPMRIPQAVEHCTARVNVFNLGVDEYCQVNDSIGWITNHLGLTPALHYSGGARGWVGDSPFIFLKCDRIRAIGWTPTLSIRGAIIRTVDYLRANQWLLERP